MRDCGLSDVLDSFDELKPEADIHYIMIRRVVPPEDKIEVVSADLKRALAAPRLGGRPGIASARSDHRVQFVGEPLANPGAHRPGSGTAGDSGHPEQLVNIDGRVKAPGRYPLEPGDARQRSDPRRRQPGGCGIPGTGGVDPLRGGGRGPPPNRADHGQSRGYQAGRCRRRLAAEAL